MKQAESDSNVRFASDNTSVIVCTLKGVANSQQLNFLSKLLFRGIGLWGEQMSLDVR